MSNSKGRRRNREKKFIDRDEDNQIGVMDQSHLGYKNKIEQKQEDMFDPHKLQQNILKEADRSYQNHFIDFGDENIVEDKEQPPPEREEVVEQKTEEPPSASKNPRKRGKRQKKAIIDSDEDIQQQNTSEIKPSQQKCSELTVQDNQVILKREQSTKNYEEEQQQSESEENKENEQETIQGIINKKSNALKNGNQHVMMHVLMDQAGFDKEERRTAIYSPLAPGQNSFIYFKRYQSGFSEYYQAIGEDQRPILFCENQRGCIGCNYYISLTKEMDKNNPSYLGKLRGNGAGSVYQLYDNGIQPKNELDRSKFRVSMAYIEYESNFLGMKGPRKLKAVIPKVKDISEFDMYKLTDEESLNTFQPPIVMNLRNKQPRWNERLKSYALNFGGRVKQASIKNFILMDDSYDLKDEDKATNLMVFGKIDENTFALEFSSPLSVFQAFGIAMSEFDFKLKCQ